ncbi:MAG: ribose-phosphate pyrophosphokinase [Candidatus Aramenus sp.]|nr:ribose-phosphate pyrophosphokinase [Candidatus Aramenus sp.]
MIIVGGPASNGIDEAISKILRADLIKAESKVFPDGESYIRYPRPLGNEEVVIVQSTYYPQDKHLIELFLMAETAKDMGASKVTAVVPYMAYLRQDRRFKDGEALSVKTVLGILSHVGCDSLVVVEPHHPEALKYFKGEVKLVDPIPALAREIKKEVEDPFVLAPDRGALSRAERLAKELGSPFSYVEKERDRTTGEVRIKELPQGNLSGKDVVLIDDIISTGGTMELASKASYKLGARKVIAAAAHALLVNNALDRLKKAGVKDVISTNSVNVQGDVKVVDISELIAVRL